MNRNALLSSFALIVILIVVGAYLAFGPERAHAPINQTATSTQTTLNTQAKYACDGGKAIAATYTDNQVVLVLSDGRSLTLAQTVSGSGIRYEQGAGTKSDIVFQSKGADAFLMENDKTTYNNCVQNAAPGGSTNGTSSFTDSGKTFSFSYPSAYAVTGGGVGYTQSWMVDATTSGLILAKLVVSRTTQPKTNFSEATFTVGTSADPSAVAMCLTANSTGGPVAKPAKAVVNGVAYMVFTSNDAGAGNFYETTSYRTVRGGQCYAIEYTIHSSNIGNYSPDQGISAFDRAKVQAVFTGIMQSFRFL